MSSPTPEHDMSKRFSEEDFVVACMSAHTSGRVYSSLGEKRLPLDEHNQMLKRALADVMHDRKERRKHRPSVPNRSRQQ